MEFHPFAQRKAPHSRFALFPGRGQAGHNLEIFVVVHQRLIDIHAACDREVFVLCVWVQRHEVALAGPGKRFAVAHQGQGDQSCQRSSQYCFFHENLLLGCLVSLIERLHSNRALAADSIRSFSLLSA